MLAGTIAQLAEPADDRLTDTTEQSTDLPALAIKKTQSDLEGQGAAQHATAAARVQQEREEPMVAEGTITTVREPVTVEVVSDLVADVAGSGVVVAERTAESGRYPFPFDLVAAQTNRELELFDVDVEGFADQFDSESILDTWMVGTDDASGTRIDYNDHADRENAGEASVGLGFELSWQGKIAEGVLYRSGYLAIYSSWPPALFMEFVRDAVLPYAFVPDDEDAEQATF